MGEVFREVKTEYEGKPVTRIQGKYHFDSIENIQKLIKDLPESGMYGTKNVEGEDVIVFREVGLGINIYTFQSNGWLSISAYTEDGFEDGQWFNGRWNK